MKKLPSLHILNGDASLGAFETADFPGQVVIWREVLSEGPVIGMLPEQEFWKRRQQYIIENCHGTAPEYKLKVLDVLEKLNVANVFFEVILWFDTDLMCQVNLLYLLQKLSKIKPAVVSVCTPVDGKAVGYLSPEEMHHVFENRQVQSEAQLQQAQQLWKLYAGPDPLQLQVYLQQNRLLEPHLEKALELHIQRFPDCKTGLGLPETEILRIVKGGATTEQELIEKFWHQQPGYGFGDLQVKQVLNRLQSELIQAEEPYKLTTLGEEVLDGKRVFSPAPVWLGGAFVTPEQGWCYSQDKKQLVPSDNLAPNMQ
ncbi:DUF1835 domain-containing protein [Pontibacter cellulosilyticus]|uniref:DUF1835 domain-containing protein n=1 Tax=Pontibacter cellulosilyticus TaxID=1720253 RepID=A0A923SH47_9BACT|nr:DUF1835 domain-containing protein [Pontibacter cellulosilyticus]MBC5991298.1 DUF1835 domain-containing protein [Pontibacter cellulosilyticus]